MKELIWLLLLSGSAVLSYASKKQQCCPNGELLQDDDTCGNNSPIKMECDGDLFLVADIILDGDKLSTQDFPNYTIVEDVSRYCTGKKYRKESQKDLGTIPVAFICFPRISTEDILTAILGFISVFFLAATLLVYTYLPKLRDLHGMCYMCLCISMGLGFLVLSIMKLGPDFMKGTLCSIGGFFTYFWLMATFFWMNVISINTYRSILHSNYMKMSARRQFFWYSCYAWGSSLIFLFVALIADLVKGEHLKPGFGENSCWFSGRTQDFIFFFTPLAVLISSNVILFMLSSYKLWKQYQVSNSNSLKYKFILTLKLFLVMGISWIFEVVSFVHGKPHFIWLILDCFNSLQGVVIFFLLVVYRRLAIQGLLQENCCLLITRPLVQTLSPQDETDDEQTMADETTDAEIRLN